MWRRAEIITGMTDFLRLVLMSLALHFLPQAASAGQPVTIFAAASLQTALKDVIAEYDGDVVVSYGGSGQIARQVAQGAPADVVILANVAWMDWLQENALANVDRRLNLLGNSLVLIAPTGAETMPGVDVQALLEKLAGGRLAIGHTTGVPAGIHGRQWLEKAGFWPVISSHLAETENVRAALALVARGEAPLGIVYATDAMAEKGVVKVYDIPVDMHDPIVYPIALTDTDNGGEASDLMTFILSDAASRIFRSHGFSGPWQSQ